MTGRVREIIGACAVAAAVAVIPYAAEAQSDRRPGGVENVQSPPQQMEGTRGVKKAAPPPTAPAPSMSAPVPSGGAAPPPPTERPATPPAKDGKSSDTSKPGSGATGAAAPSTVRGVGSATRGPGGSNERRVGGVENVQTKD